MGKSLVKPETERNLPPKYTGSFNPIKASEYIPQENKVFQRCPSPQRALAETETLSLSLGERGKNAKVVFDRHASSEREFLSAFWLSDWGPPPFRDEEAGAWA